MASPSAMTSSRAVCVVLLTAAVMLQAVAGQATVTQQIVEKFQDLTTLSDQVRIRTEQINILTAISEGQSIWIGLDRIIQSVNGGMTLLSVAALSDADATTVVAALTKFVQEHQGLLKAVIKKHELSTLFFSYGRIGHSLVSLKASVDSFANNLIAIIPTQKPAADQQFRALTVYLEAAISIYQQPL